MQPVNFEYTTPIVKIFTSVTKKHKLRKVSVSKYAYFASVGLTR